MRYRKVNIEEIKNLNENDKIYLCINSQYLLQTLKEKPIFTIDSKNERAWKINTLEGNSFIVEEKNNDLIYITEKILEENLLKRKEYKKITHKEFINLQYGDEIYIKLAGTMFHKIVYKPPYYDEQKKKWTIKTFTPRMNYYEDEVYLEEKVKEE